MYKSISAAAVAAALLFGAQTAIALPSPGAHVNATSGIEEVGYKKHRNHYKHRHWRRHGHGHHHRHYYRKRKGIHIHVR